MKNKINIAVVGLGNIGSYFCNEIVKKKKDILQKLVCIISPVPIGVLNFANLIKCLFL